VTNLVLVVRRSIHATAERLFDVWTQPEHLKQWWGPRSVVCIDAQIDLQVGGRYRLANQFPDGKVVWISGEFETIERPHKLVYTWRLAAEAGTSERVSVTFEARSDATEVIVTHERILHPAARDQHEQGWVGCLEGLAQYLAA
jgi:glutathione S-transferase